MLPPPYSLDIKVNVYWQPFVGWRGCKEFDTEDTLYAEERCILLAIRRVSVGDRCLTYNLKFQEAVKPQ